MHSKNFIDQTILDFDFLAEFDMDDTKAFDVFAEAIVNCSSQLTSEPNKPSVPEPMLPTVVQTSNEYDFRRVANTDSMINDLLQHTLFENGLNDAEDKTQGESTLSFNQTDEEMDTTEPSTLIEQHVECEIVPCDDQAIYYDWAAQWNYAWTS